MQLSTWHGCLFDDGCLYRLAEEGERGGSCPVGLFIYVVGC